MLQDKAQHFRDLFNVNADISNVQFTQINIEFYNQPPNNNAFGEELCSVCKCNFTIHKIDVSLKVLFFVYETHAEVLKLEINIHNEQLGKEITACRNFLQRKRNLNLTFEVLLKFTQLYETRRQIIETVLKKQPFVTVQYAEGIGYTIKCFNEQFAKLLLAIEWALNWHVDTYEVSDLVDFHCSNDILDKEKMATFKTLVKPQYNSHYKLKLWRLLIKELYDGEIFTVDLTEEQVLELPDSDSEDESVIEVKDDRLEEIIL